MTIGIIVDGGAEAIALAPLINKLRGPDCTILNPIYADIQPKSTPKQIVQSSLQKLKILHQRGATEIIVLIDLEEKSRCASNFATELTAAYSDMSWPQVQAVVKDIMFENWLLSDPAALKQMRARFEVTNKFERLVSNNRADKVEKPIILLNEICRGKKPYHKRDDAVAIAARLEPMNMARNSRSFRRFLRVLGHPDFRGQSKNPIM